LPKENQYSIINVKYYIKYTIIKEPIGGNNTPPSGKGDNNKPNGAYDENAKVNSSDTSKLPQDTTKYVTWDNYTEQIHGIVPENWYNYTRRSLYGGVNAGIFTFSRYDGGAYYITSFCAILI